MRGGVECWLHSRTAFSLIAHRVFASNLRTASRTLTRNQHHQHSKNGTNVNIILICTVCSLGDMQQVTVNGAEWQIISLHQCFRALCGSPARRLICMGAKRHPLTPMEQRAVVLGTAVAAVDTVASIIEQAAQGIDAREFCPAPSGCRGPMVKSMADETQDDPATDLYGRVIALEAIVKRQ